jgi:hypothetical protein
MKELLSAIAISSLLITTVSAEEAATQLAKADSATEDCSKQVWPTVLRRASACGSSNQCTFSDNQPSMKRNDWSALSFAISASAPICLRAA